MIRVRVKLRVRVKVRVGTKAGVTHDMVNQVFLWQEIRPTSVRHLSSFLS